MDALLGFEPRLTESESALLPVRGQGSIGCSGWIRTNLYRFRACRPHREDHRAVCWISLQGSNLLRRQAQRASKTRSRTNQHKRENGEPEWNRTTCGGLRARCSPRVTKLLVQGIGTPGGVRTHMPARGARFKRPADHQLSNRCMKKCSLPRCQAFGLLQWLMCDLHTNTL